VCIVKIWPSVKKKRRFSLDTKIMTNEMILSHALIIDVNLSSLSIAELQNINSLNPAAMVRIYEFILLTGYGVTFPFPLTQYRMLTIGMDASEVRDFNQYSQQALLKPRTDDDYSSDYDLHGNQSTQPVTTTGDDMLLVTTL
jgi:hypothetical protein